MQCQSVQARNYPGKARMLGLLTSSGNSICGIGFPTVLIRYDVQRDIQPAMYTAPFTINALMTVRQT